MKLLKISLSILLLFSITIVNSQDYTPKYSPETCIKYFKKLYVPLSEGAFEYSKYQEDVKICQECLSCYPSVILKSSEKIYWTANNKQLKLSFEVIPGGVMGQKYDIMKGNGVLGTVEKTGRNKYKAKLYKHIRPYAFISGKLDKRYVDLIKTAINTDRDLNFRDVNDKTGVIIFTTILDK